MTEVSYLVVQVQHLIVIAACFVLLGLVQLSDFPQLLSQLPHLLLQSLLIAAPRALSTHNTTQFTVRHKNALRGSIIKCLTVVST